MHLCLAFPFLAKSSDLSERLNKVRSAFEQNLGQQGSKTPGPCSLTYDAYLSFLKTCPLSSVKSILDDPFSIITPEIQKQCTFHADLTVDDLEDMGAFYAQKYRECFAEIFSKYRWLMEDASHWKNRTLVPAVKDFVQDLKKFWNPLNNPYQSRLWNSSFKVFEQNNPLKEGSCAGEAFLASMNAFWSGQTKNKKIALCTQKPNWDYWVKDIQENEEKYRWEAGIEEIKEDLLKKGWRLEKEQLQRLLGAHSLSSEEEKIGAVLLYVFHLEQKNLKKRLEFFNQITGCQFSEQEIHFDRFNYSRTLDWLKALLAEKKEFCVTVGFNSNSFTAGGHAISFVLKNAEKIFFDSATSYFAKKFLKAEEGVGLLLSAIDCGKDMAGYKIKPSFEHRSKKDDSYIHWTVYTEKIASKASNLSKNLTDSFARLNQVRGLEGNCPVFSYIPAVFSNVLLENSPDLKSLLDRRIRYLLENGDWHLELDKYMEFEEYCECIFQRSHQLIQDLEAKRPNLVRKKEAEDYKRSLGCGYGILNVKEYQKKRQEEIESWKVTSGTTQDPR